MEIEQLCCNRCKEVFDHNGADLKCTFIGTLEEPPEYELRCPRCGSAAVDTTYRVVCDGCEIRPVKHNGSFCDECQAELAVDAVRGH